VLLPGLRACVIKEGIVNRRLETFAHICGITLDGHKEGHGNFTEIQSSYYFRALGIIFGQNLHLLEESMNSFVSNTCYSERMLIVESAHVGCAVRLRLYMPSTL
jgi:hypothetical protein